MRDDVVEDDPVGRLAEQAGLQLPGLAIDVHGRPRPKRGRIDHVPDAARHLGGPRQRRIQTTADHGRLESLLLGDTLKADFAGDPQLDHLMAARLGA